MCWAVLVSTLAWAISALPSPRYATAMTGIVTVPRPTPRSSSQNPEQPGVRLRWHA